MDKIDAKILFELDNDARQSYGQIASKLKTSKQVVGNRINSLIESGRIKKFLTILDLSKLGLILNKVYVRLFRASLDDELKILNFLNQHKNVAWLARTEGIYDFAFALHTTTSIIEINEILQEFENKFGKFILEKLVNRVITGEFFHRDYLVENRKSGFRKNVIFQTQEQTIKLDKIDFTILAALCRDSRESAVNISKKVPITADAIGRRIKKMGKMGVIKNHIIVPDNSKLNQIHYKVLLKITNFNQQVEKKFLEFCRQNNNIILYNKNIGSWEIEIDIEISNSEGFREIMRDIKKEFADSIREYYSLIIYDVMKFDFLPMYEF